MQIKNNKWKNIILLILGFTGIVFVFEIIPRFVDTGSLLVEWFNQNNQIEKMNEIDSRINVLTSSNGKLKSEIGSVVSDYEENQKISSVLNIIDDIATKSKVNIESIKPNKISKNENLWLQPIDINLVSRYEGFYNFIKFLENSQKVILVKDIQIKPANNLTGKLDIAAKLEVYLNL